MPPPAARPALRERLRRELGYSQDAVIFLTAARMHPQKRPLDLVGLARRVSDLPDLHFLIVGGGELEDEVDRAIAEGTGQIRRLPFRTDIPELIAACDVGCLVSDYEGLPVFMLECLQLGVPFLGTDVGDLGSVVRRAGAGWIVDRPGDLAALESAARQASDPEARRRRAERALAAAPNFGVEACAERYEAVFRGRRVPDVVF
ncbi:MAG: glycosyltransferase family 4 protein [Acidobacteriota bacterium]